MLILASQRKRGLSFFIFTATSAPAFSRTFTLSSSLVLAAYINALHPSSSRSLILAPALIKAFTVSESPSSEAIIRGVLPSLSFVFTSAPAAMRALATSGSYSTLDRRASCSTRIKFVELSIHSLGRNFEICRVRCVVVMSWLSAMRKFFVKGCGNMDHSRRRVFARSVRPRVHCFPGVRC